MAQSHSNSVSKGGASSVSVVLHVLNIVHDEYSSQSYESWLFSVFLSTLFAFTA